MNVDVPSELLCPLTNAMMQDPVLTICDHTFDRSAIEAWFVTEDCCPQCHRVLSLKELRPSDLVLGKLTSFQLGLVCAMKPGSEGWLRQLAGLVARELRRCEGEDMKLFLEENGLGMYFEALVRNGFLTLSSLARLKEADCGRVGVASSQRGVLLGAVAELQAPFLRLDELILPRGQTSASVEVPRRLAERLDLEQLKSAVERKACIHGVEVKQSHKQPSDPLPSWNETEALPKKLQIEFNRREETVVKMHCKADGQSNVEARHHIAHGSGGDSGNGRGSDSGGSAGSGTSIGNSGSWRSCGSGSGSSSSESGGISSSTTPTSLPTTAARHENSSTKTRSSTGRSDVLNEVVSDNTGTSGSSGTTSGNDITRPASGTNTNTS